MRTILLLIGIIYKTLTWAQCSFTLTYDICGYGDGAGPAIQLENGDFIIGGGGVGCDGNPSLPVLMRVNCKGGKDLA